MKMLMFLEIFAAVVLTSLGVIIVLLTIMLIIAGIRMFKENMKDD